MPRSPRAIVCACEDLTVGDIEQCIEKGYRDVESIKRYTGFGTGICQGKGCLHLVSRVMKARGIDGVAPFTARPPHTPVALGMLARLEEGPPRAPARDTGDGQVEADAIEIEETNHDRTDEASSDAGEHSR